MTHRVARRQTVPLLNVASNFPYAEGDRFLRTSFVSEFVACEIFSNNIIGGPANKACIVPTSGGYRARFSYFLLASRNFVFHVISGTSNSKQICIYNMYVVCLHVYNSLLKKKIISIIADSICLNSICICRPFRFLYVLVFVLTAEDILDLKCFCKLPPKTKSDHTLIRVCMCMCVFTCIIICLHALQVCIALVPF